VYKPKSAVVGYLYYNMLYEFYLSNIIFISINNLVPQGSDLSPDLFNIYTADIPVITNTTLATYADDTAILCANNDPDETSNCLQTHLDSIDTWQLSGE